MRFKTTVPALLAEFIGTYALVFFGCGAIILSELENLSSAVIPIIFGLTITIFVYLLGRFSGAHFNPAVTIGFLLNKEISIKDSVFYIGIQILGGMLASQTHVALFGRMHSFGVTTLSVDVGQGFFLEAFCTGLLMFVILQVTRKENNIYGIAIGGTVFISALLIGELYRRFTKSCEKYWTCFSKWQDKGDLLLCVSTSHRKLNFIKTIYNQIFKKLKIKI